MYPEQQSYHTSCHHDSRKKRSMAPEATEGNRRMSPTCHTLISLVFLLLGWITFEWSYFGSLSSRPFYRPPAPFIYGVGAVAAVILLVVLSIYIRRFRSPAKLSVEPIKKPSRCTSFPRTPVSSPMHQEAPGSFPHRILPPFERRQQQRRQDYSNKIEDHGTYQNAFDGYERHAKRDGYERFDERPRMDWNFNQPEQQSKQLFNVLHTQATPDHVEHQGGRVFKEQQPEKFERCLQQKPEPQQQKQSEAISYLLMNDGKGGAVNSAQLRPGNALNQSQSINLNTLNQKPTVSEPGKLQESLDLLQTPPVEEEEGNFASLTRDKTPINYQRVFVPIGPPPLPSPTSILEDSSHSYSLMDSSAGASSVATSVGGSRPQHEPFLHWPSATKTTVPEHLNLNDLYVFHVPISELVRYFTMPENKKSLPTFYNKVLENIDIISAPVAADLIRLPVKANCNNLEFTRALCSRILQFPVKARNLTSMQIALVGWSLAKTPQGLTTGRRPGEFNCSMILNSLAEEALCKAKEFEPLSIANFLWACGKLRYRNDKLLNQLADVAAAQLELFNAQNIANTYWSLGTLEAGFTALTPRLANGPLPAAVIGTLVQKLPGFNSQAVANFVWACARLQWNVPQLLQAACHVAVRTHPGFKPQEMANFMWGIAKLGYSNGIFAIEVFAKRAAANLRLFNSQEVSNAYWALGTLELRGTCLTPMSLSVPVDMPTANANFPATPIGSTTTSSVNLPSRAASTIDLAAGRSFSATPSTQESLLEKQHQKHVPIDSQAAERQPHENELLTMLLHKMEHFNSQAIANFIWACGKLQWKSLELCAAFRAIIERNIPYFRPQNTANILWAFAKLRVNDVELNRILIGAAVSRLDDFNTQEIANVYWAIGTLELQDSLLTPAVLDINQKGPQQLQSPVCRAIKEKLPNFKPQEIANFLWACARLRWRPSDVLDVATEVALRCAERFKPQEIGNLVWALAKLNYRHVELLNTMCDYAALNIQHFTPQNVANIYWAIGSLTFSQTLLSNDHPSPEFLNSLIQLITMFNDQEITNFLWSCGRLRWEVKEIISVVSQIVVRKARIFRRKELLNLQWAFKKLGHHDLVEILEDAMTRDSSQLHGPETVNRFPLLEGYLIQDTEKENPL